MFLNKAKLALIVGASVQPILATADGMSPDELTNCQTIALGGGLAMVDQLCAQEAQERQAARQTPEGLRKLALSQAATVAKAVATGLMCELASRLPQTNQERLGMAKLAKVGPQQALIALERALHNCGIDPKQFVPQGGKSAKAAPEQVCRLAQLDALIKVAQRLAGTTEARKAA